ncbi:MAG: tRNA (adenosine(37)-N6)-dimethylallyltransferase MiaA [Chloroflexi bacterium]|nr:MAG: tRNA (adenosine(37)-N6)-dimethylallyltransferase MiaA [Chloroflexota bacterium]HDN80157.1 tRNA (adenosine(37)-N6)-dimethylallyltransferase MiaA [Chloroflexota bacterium]
MSEKQIPGETGDVPPPLVAIVGPTGVGKTQLALRLGEEMDIEVVSADSRQVYRYMDIGTAKPTPEERKRVPHHIIDVVDPDEEFTLAQFQEMARAAIEDILRRGKLPLLVGGTGQYVWAVLEGWQVPRVPPQHELRRQLYREAEEKGHQALFERLRELDPKAAEFIDPRNVRRVVRAIEVCLITGKPFSSQREKSPPPYRTLIIGLTMERAELYRRIDARIEKMLEKGLVEEVQRLLARGYGPDLPSMSGVGYWEIGRYLQGEISLDEAVRLMKKRTRNFVRHQYNWFRLTDPRIHWLESDENAPGKARDLISRFLSEL